MSAAKTIVIIGASTGGTRLLPEMLATLPPLPAAFLIVQHMPPFIAASFLRTLAASTAMKVTMARDGADLASGEIALVPGGVHCSLANNQTLKVGPGPKVNFVCPSIDVAMQSLKAPVNGQRLFAILLTGMGRDGAAGMAHIKSLGGTTIVQDKRSCAVYGMPAEAVRLGCVDYQLAPAQITRLLASEIGIQTTRKPSLPIVRPPTSYPRERRPAPLPA